MSDTDVTSATVHQSARKGLANSALGTRNLMTIAALAVVGSIIVVPLSYLSTTLLLTPKGLLISCSIMGVWLIPYLLPAVVTRKPGAAMIAGLIMGVIAAFTTPTGPMSIVGNLIGAAFIEVPLAVMLYRKWTWWSFGISSMVFGGINATMYLTMVQGSPSGPMTATIFASSLVSCIVGLAACLGLNKLLNKAGVGVAQQR